MEVKKHCFRCLKPILSGEEQHYGLHTRPCFQVWFQNAMDPFANNDELPMFQSLMLKSQDDSSNNIILSSNFQGRYKKYSATLGTKHYILKVQEKDYPELPATEYLCNQIAEFLKIPVPNYYLLRFNENENINLSFVVINFMQSLHGANLKHIYHYLKTSNEFNCEAILAIIRNNTKQKKDIEIFIEMCLFDALIGNHDRHGRNFGFIETNKGKWLAPIYDNPSYIGIEESFLESDLEPTGRIPTNLTNNPTMQDYIYEFKRLGFTEKISNFKKKVDLKGIFNLIDNSFISKIRQTAMKTLVKKRYLVLNNE